MMTGIGPETVVGFPFLLPFLQCQHGLSDSFRLSMGSKGDPHCPSQLLYYLIDRDSLYANNPARKDQKVGAGAASLSGTSTLRETVVARAAGIMPISRASSRI